MTRAVLALLTACASAPVTNAAPVSPSGEIGFESQLVDGTVTLVDFWADWCGACVTVAGHVAVAIAREDRIRVIKIDVGDGTTPIARKYGVGSLPHWQVYDTRKRLRYNLLGDQVLRAPELARELLAEPASK